MSTTPGLQSSKIKNRNNLHNIENIDIELTNKCNFDCIYCYVNRTDEKHLDLLYIQNILNFCLDNKIKNITFTGGEPFLYKNIDSLMKLINDFKIEATFFTNGSYLKKIMKTHDLTKINICLKRDCVDNNLQAQICGLDNMPYNFEELISDIRNNVKEVTVHSALTSRNYLELPKLYKICKKKNIPHYISRVVPRRGEIKKYLPTVEMCKNVFEKIAIYENKELTIPFVGDIGCIKMYCSLFINRFGIIQPCSNLPFQVGMVNTNHIDIFARKLKKFRTINKFIIGKCKTCSYANKCYGCRSIAYWLSGNYLEEDPLCWRTA